MNYIIKSIGMTTLIFWCISFGTALYLNGYNLFGYFNAAVGSIAVYMLCLKYFANSIKNEEGKK